MDVTVVGARGDVDVESQVGEEEETRRRSKDNSSAKAASSEAGGLATSLHYFEANGRHDSILCAAIRSALHGLPAYGLWPPHCMSYRPSFSSLFYA